MRWPGANHVAIGAPTEAARPLGGAMTASRATAQKPSDDSLLSCRKKLELRGSNAARFDVAKVVQLDFGKQAVALSVGLMCA